MLDPRAAAIGLLGRTPSAPGTRVRQVAVPPAARALSTLSRVDYADAFLVELDRAQDRTAEQWARAILEDVPTLMRTTLPWGWSALGLQRGPARSDAFVFGWEVRRSTADLVLLRAGSRFGLPAELLFKRRRHAVLFATLLQHDNHIARTVWAGVAPLHRQVVRHVLEQGTRSERRE